MIDAGLLTELYPDNYLMDNTFIIQNWAFGDFTKKGSDGKYHLWDLYIVFLIKEDGKWKFLKEIKANEDPQEITSQMPPEIKRAFEEWDSGHF